MADDKKTGPVKPPIIDAQAVDKPTQGEKPATPKPAAKKPVDSEPKATSVPPKRPEQKSAPKTDKEGSQSKAKNPTILLPMVGATIIGAGLGIAGTSFLAMNNIAPFQKSISISEFNGTIEALQKRVYDLENAPAIDTSGFASIEQVNALATQPSGVDPSKLEALQSQINNDLSALTAKVEAIDSAGNSNTSDEVIASLQAEIDGLKSTIVELSPENSASLEAQLDLNQKVAKISADIDNLSEAQIANASEVATVTEQLAALSSRLDATSAELQAATAQNEEQPASASLPLVLSAWQRAQENGEPFDRYVTAVAQQLDGFTANEMLVGDATYGVATTAQLRDQFDVLVPLLLESLNAADESQQWYDKILGQVRTAVGLRSLDQTGDAPEAIIARLEASLENNQLARAQSEFEALPEDMQQKAGEFAVALFATVRAENALAEAQNLAIELATKTEGASQ